MDNYFELYGIPPSLRPDTALVRKQYYALSRQYHPDRFATADTPTRLEALRMAALNNEAWQTLSDPDRLMAYVLKLQGVLENEEKYTLPPDFLMEMMDLNEALEAGDDTAVAQWQQAMQDWEATAAPLLDRYDAGDRSEALLKKMKDHYFRKKYLLRLREQIGS